MRLTEAVYCLSCISLPNPCPQFDHIRQQIQKTGRSMPSYLNSLFQFSFLIYNFSHCSSSHFSPISHSTPLVFVLFSLHFKLSVFLQDMISLFLYWSLAFVLPTGHFVTVPSHALFAFSPYTFLHIEILGMKLMRPEPGITQDIFFFFLKFWWQHIISNSSVIFVFLQSAFPFVILSVFFLISSL